MTFIHTRAILPKKNNCDDLKAQYLACLQHNNSQMICKRKLFELLLCVGQTKPPALIRKGN